MPAQKWRDLLDCETTSTVSAYIDQIDFYVHGNE